VKAVERVRSKMVAQIFCSGRARQTSELVQRIGRKLREVLKKHYHKYRLGLASRFYNQPNRARLVFLIDGRPSGAPLIHNPDHPRVDFDVERR
jgi:hypothetical protein